MAEFVFTSPGVKFREVDLSFVVRNVGITTLGAVGETEKGPAFEPVFIEDQGQFRTRFGGQNIEKFPNGELRYQLPYVANSYLEESSQLWITRVLGLSGYDAGTAWAITLSAGVDPSTTGQTGNNVFTTGITFTDNTYLGVTISAVGETYEVFTGFTKTGPTSFTGIYVEFSATTLVNGSGTVDQWTYEVSGASYAEYEDMVLAVVRSRATVEDVVDASSITEFFADTVEITANGTNTGTGDLFASFQLSASSSVDSSSEDYIVSLNPDDRDFISNVLGTRPKSKKTKLWVEAVFPDLIKKIDAEGFGYGINTAIIDADSDAFTNYEERYQTPETPWVVSELRGSEVERLFKFVSISDGNAANREIKISIANINIALNEFDIIIRDFNDTDNNPVVLESFQRCTMTRGLTNYVGNRIGTLNGEYDLQSNYVSLVIDEDAPIDSFPAGFEGYFFKDWATSATTSSVAGVAPAILYKTEYDADDRLTRVYLGISEDAYSTDNLIGTGINQNYFNYKGQSGFVKSNGFHMDSGATGTYFDGETLVGEFEVGAASFKTTADVNDPTNPYSDQQARKFTLVPAGGFDGWNEHRNGRSNGDNYRKGGIYDGVIDGAEPSNDFQAWTAGIRTFSNPEEITINVFATPSIDWSFNNVLVKDTLDMIENERTDSIYIIDSPDLEPVPIQGEELGVTIAKDISGLLDSADIDSSYAATYYPWVKQADSDNNVNVLIPPTAQVVAALAFTDNTAFPWFAPAGVTRGATDAKDVKFKFSEEARGILYQDRINALSRFSNVGVAIFGQKTLQVRESKLDRVNVRRLLLQVKVIIANISIRLLFEQNDQATIDQFLAQANPALDAIKRERGLEAFSIKMDDSNNSPESRDRNELFGEIFLKPIGAVEFIGITFTITPSGASFEDI